MATSSLGFHLTGFVATGDLSGSQFKLVKLGSTAGTVKVADAATDKVVGVLGNSPADGEPAEVQILGVAKALSEASVTAGDYVASSSTGRCKTTTTANDDPIGIALDSGAAGDLIRVLIRGFNY